jgi:uncharacterized phage-associated protein
MYPTEANIEKIIAVLLFVLNKSKHHSFDIHKLCKILYFADQKHLVRYGRTIVKDTYIAMDWGSVPSYVYDVYKSIKANKSESLKFQEYFEVFNGTDIYAKVNPNEEILSESEIECLIESVNENKDLEFNDLVEKSHQQAWSKARLNSPNSPISIFDIAVEAGANKAMINYINFNIENEAELV